VGERKDFKNVTQIGRIAIVLAYALQTVPKRDVVMSRDPF